MLDFDFDDSDFDGEFCDTNNDLDYIFVYVAANS